MVGLEHTWKMFLWRVYDFSFGFGRISGKMDEISKIWAISGDLRSRVGSPHNNVGPRQGMACPCHGMAKRGLGQASGTPQRSSAMPQSGYYS